MTNRNDCCGVPDGAWLIGVDAGATRGEAVRFTGLCDKHITNHGFIFIHIFKPFVTASYDKKKPRSRENIWAMSVTSSPSEMFMMQINTNGLNVSQHKRAFDQTENFFHSLFFF